MKISSSSAPQYLQSLSFFLSRLMYSDIYSMLRVNGTLTRPFSVMRGIRQGCPLSGLLDAISVSGLLYAISLSGLLYAISISGLLYAISL